MMMNRNDDVCWAPHQISILWFARQFFPFIGILWTSEVASWLHQRWLISASIKLIEAWCRQDGERRGLYRYDYCLWLIFSIRFGNAELARNNKRAKPRAAAQFEEIWVLKLDAWRNRQNRPEKGWTWRCVFDDVAISRQPKDVCQWSS